MRQEICRENECELGSEDEDTMPHLLATYTVHYYWEIPDDVVLLEVMENDYREREGVWYIKHTTLHYYWKDKWFAIEGKQDEGAGGEWSDEEFVD